MIDQSVPDQPLDRTCPDHVSYERLSQMHTTTGISSTAAAPVALVGPQHGAAIPAWLSEMPEKRVLYAADTYFRESWEDAQAAFVDPERDLPALASITFKPDAFAGRIVTPALHWLIEQGFRVVAARDVLFDRLTIRGIWYYQWNIASRDRKDVVDELLAASRSLVVTLQLSGRPDATKYLSTIKGPAVPSRRRPGQLRHVLASPNTLLNFVHTADETADLVRELGVYFPAEQRQALFQELVEGGDRLPEALAIAARIEAQTPTAELRLAPVLRSLREQLAAATGDHAELAAALALGEDGGKPDWRQLLQRLQQAAIPVSQWQRLVIATALVDMDVPTGEVLVRGVSSGAAAREHP